MKAPVSGGGGGGTSAETRGRVLLVDDDADLLEATAETLEEAGFAVETAHDGHEALARTEACAPEVVVADVEMPGMNGHELCRRVRAAGHDEVPFLFCSGLGAPRDRVEGLQAGADDYIVQPAGPDEVVLKLTPAGEPV